MLPQRAGADEALGKTAAATVVRRLAIGAPTSPAEIQTMQYSRLVSCCAALLVAQLGAPGAFAQETAPRGATVQLPTPTAAGQPMPAARVPQWPFRIEAGEVRLPDLIGRVAVQLGRNYLFQPSEFQPPSSSLNLQSAMVLPDVATLETAFSQLLHVQGYAIIARTPELGLFEIVSMYGPSRARISEYARYTTPDDVLASRGRMEQVACAVSLQHMNAQNASISLRPFFAQSAGSVGGLVVGNDGTPRSILLQGSCPQVAAAIEMLRLGDTAAGEAAASEAAAREAAEQPLVAQLQDLQRRVVELEKKLAAR
ncbi:MAG: hypothetical protein IPM29_30465 [Planctomycetes bacterium]|nr:hypothetical protein [Planctomycetota bacterium]